MSHYRNFTLLAASLLGLVLNTASAWAEPRSVIDDSGRQVELPDQVERIAETWFAHQELLMTLGAGPRIVATVNNPQTRPWMFKVQPLPDGTALTHGDAFNVESLLAARVDVVFTATAGERNALAYEQAGIPTLRMNFTDLPSLQRSLVTTAQVLGTPEARQRAEAYNAYLDEKLHEVHTLTDPLTDAQRPRVLHIASLNPLRVDGSGTLIDDWIKVAGGRNAATGLNGNQQPVSGEQLLAWQPDVIILAANAGALDSAPDAALFKHLPAVTQGRLLRNPDGVFPWDRYGTEAALQIQWAARQLHPERFSHVNMIERTIDFYRRFFDYPLKPEDAQRILDGLPPAS